MLLIYFSKNKFFKLPLDLKKKLVVFYPLDSSAKLQDGDIHAGSRFYIHCSVVEDQDGIGKEK